MRWVRTAAETRAAETPAVAGVDEATLIGRASWAVAHRVLQVSGGGYGVDVLVAAGSGHNGADALWAGVHLARRGARVTAYRATGRAADEHAVRALRELARAGGRQATVDEVVAGTPYDVGIDGVTGLGYTPRDGDAEEALAAACELLRSRSGLVVAVDLPSGVEPDTGRAASWAMAADVTVTFGALKPGLVLGAGAELAGVVDVAGIGLAPGEPTALGTLDADDVAELLPTPGPRATKYSRGGVGLIGGGEDYVGAAVLASGGALRAGAGIVRMHAPRETIAAVRARWPEVVGIPVDLSTIAHEKKVDAWVVGPGLGTDDTAQAILDAVLDRPEPVVVDADAITLLGRSTERLRARRAPTVLTPHAAEFERLTDVAVRDAAADPLGAVRRAAADLGVTVLLKGMRTVVAAPDGTARVNPTGTAWLASAGSGDVLAGAVGAYLAAGLAPLDAAACAAWLHGLAARLAARDAPLLASDVIDRWPAAHRQVRGGGR